MVIINDTLVDCQAIVPLNEILLAGHGFHRTRMSPTAWMCLYPCPLQWPRSRWLHVFVKRTKTLKPWRRINLKLRANTNEYRLLLSQIIQNSRNDDLPRGAGFDDQIQQLLAGRLPIGVYVFKSLALGAGCKTAGYCNTALKYLPINKYVHNR
jgi:hypothetical protein